MYPYDVALIQSPCHVIRRRDERDELIKQNIKRITQLASFAANRIGEIKIAVAGEYSLYGMFRPRSLEEWIDLALAAFFDVSPVSLGLFFGGARNLRQAQNIEKR